MKAFLISPNCERRMCSTTAHSICMHMWSGQVDRWIARVQDLTLTVWQSSSIVSLPFPTTLFTRRDVDQLNCLALSHVLSTLVCIQGEAIWLSSDNGLRRPLPSFACAEGLGSYFTEYCSSLCKALLAHKNDQSSPTMPCLALPSPRVAVPYAKQATMVKTVVAELITWLPEKKTKQGIIVLSGQDSKGLQTTHEEQAELANVPRSYVSYLKPNMTVVLVDDFTKYPARGIPQPVSVLCCVLVINQALFLLQCPALLFCSNHIQHAAFPYKSALHDVCQRCPEVGHALGFACCCTCRQKCLADVCHPQ